MKCKEVKAWFSIKKESLIVVVTEPYLPKAVVQWTPARIAILLYNLVKYITTFLAPFYLIIK